MKITVTESMFIEQFKAYGRQDNFSLEGLKMLFEFLEDMETGHGEEMELDVIGLCCDFSEETAQEVNDNYSLDIEECEDEDELTDLVKDELESLTMVVGVTSDNKIIYADF